MSGLARNAVKGWRTGIKGEFKMVDPVRSVRKRDGRIEDFDKAKIFEGIIKAYELTRPGRGRAIAFDIARNVYKVSIRPWVFKYKKEFIETKDIQRRVEYALMEHCPDIARTYIICAYIKEEKRRQKKKAEKEAEKNGD